MTWRYKIWIGIFVAGALLAGCSDNDTNPISAQPSDEFVFSAQFLYAFFVFQELLPPDPFEFSSPRELYASVNEPYTVYIPPDTAKAFLDNLNTESAGIGIRVDSTAAGFVVLQVIEQSPAAEAGLQEGDTLVAVNGVSLVGKSFEEFSELVSGDQGTNLTFSVHRDNQQLSITIMIDTFLSPSVFVDSLDSAIAYIRIVSFFSRTSSQGGTAQEFATALEQTSWAQSTILDFRDNPGGELGQAYGVADELLGRDEPIIRIVERAIRPDGTAFTRDTIIRASQGGAGVGRDFVVLMNQRTASASELVIAALETNRPSLITVGSSTFGKARGQVLQFTPDSALARVTYALLQPVMGTPYDQVGISADIEVAPGVEPLQAAVDQAETTLAKQAAVPRGALRRVAWQFTEVRPKSDLPIGYRWAEMN